MKKALLTMAAIILPFFVQILLVQQVCAMDLSAEEILEKVDRNISASTRIFKSKMVVHGRRSSRTVVSRSWAEGEIKAFTEYLAPARERGSKMLKLDKKLWIYSPTTDRIIQISGHMLRQSLMGSDLSYEDMMEDKKMAENYSAVLAGTESIRGSICWVLDLTAKVEDLAYFRLKIWVDKERLIPLKETFFAKSGKLLKRLELTDVERIQDRWFPKKMIFKDMLKKGKGTAFIIEDIVFDREIPRHIFSKAALKK